MKSTATDTPNRISQETQATFWNDWNRRHRMGSSDAYMERQAEVAVDVAQSVRPQHILEIGCGTGWLSHRLSSIAPTTGVDLSPEAIAAARQAYPEATFRVVDVMTDDLPTADLIVSCDVIAHVPNQAHFVSQCAKALPPGGTLLLQTQNPFVWSRSSALRPPEPGQLRQWLTQNELRTLLEPSFEVRSATTIFPAGDQGMLALLNSRVSNAVLRRLLGGNQSMMRFKERIGVGQEIVVTAIRR